MKVSVLGPVTAEHAGVGLRLGGRKQRAVLALLAMNVNSPVALDRLVHELWRDEPPAQATLSLQSYISRLRRTFSEAHRGGGEDAPTILTRALARKSHAMAELSGERTLGNRLETLARTLLADPSPEQLS
jgi:DNA-binding SARP family transcriptional activator